MPEHTPAAVEKEIVRLFGTGSLKGVLNLLDRYPSHMPGQPDPGQARIHLAILKLSQGNIGDIPHYVEQAIKDFRDVLYWAEYYDR